MVKNWYKSAINLYNIKNNYCDYNCMISHMFNTSLYKMKMKLYQIYWLYF